MVAPRCYPSPLIFCRIPKLSLDLQKRLELIFSTERFRPQPYSWNHWVLRRRSCIERDIISLWCRLFKHSILYEASEYCALCVYKNSIGFFLRGFLCFSRLLLVCSFVDVSWNNEILHSIKDCLEKDICCVKNCRIIILCWFLNNVVFLLTHYMYA